MSTSEHKSDSVGLDILRSVQGASRYARSYAFLYAAFEQRTNQSVKDALDCLTPFITAYTHRISGQQLDLQGLQKFLRVTFGFTIPIYALERMLPELRRAGYVDFRSGIKIWIALAKEDSFKVAQAEIDTEFEDIQSTLQRYAVSSGFDSQPPSGDWGLALINFLKPDPPAVNRGFVNIRDALIDARETERKIVASFIRKIWEEQPTRYEKILKIFMGVLVEDFLSGMEEIGEIDRKSPLVISYDTSILLRSLGCSGSLYKAATDELTRYLQDIGCQIKFIGGNEAEVNNVLSTILDIKDAGGELEGETAEAISRGEIGYSRLRMLQNNFVEELARANIFELQETTPAIISRAHQINEVGFGAFLQDQASRRGRGYSIQSRQNDAGYVATVMRLRRGSKSRDFAKAGYIFVTSNQLLAYASQEYLIKERQLSASQCAPVLHITQVATIAWLLRDQKLSPEIAGRELLVNCYAAARPTADWFKFFREGIEKAVGDMETFGQDPKGSFVLQAARRIAQEQSFGNSAIMRQLNTAEIIDEARKVAASQEQSIRAEHETHITRVRAAAREEADTEARAVLHGGLEDAARGRQNGLYAEYKLRLPYCLLHHSLWTLWTLAHDRS